MAKAKKKESTLTLEEKLVQALVPESEQPYKVPKNWCWTRLNFVGEYKKGPFGSAITKAMFVPKGDDTYKVYEQGNAIRKTIKYGEYYITEDKYKELKRFEVVPGDFIVSCAGTVGETYQIPIGAERGIINQALMRIRLSEIVCDDYFLNYFDDALRQDITGKAKGTAMKNIPPFAVLKKFPFPLPPFSEQQRIVERIESLFSKLDEAKEKLQQVLDGFETRKAAILHKAFTGELTAKWREEHGVSLDSWEKKKLGECGKWIGGGTPSMSHSEYWEDGNIPWVTSKDMKYSLIDDTLLHTNKLGIENSSANYIESDAVLFVMRSGILRRTLPISMIKKPFCVNQDLKAMVPFTMDVDYFYWVCKCYAQSILRKCMKSGTTVESINSSELMEFVIPVAKIDEQKVIVLKIVEAFTAEEKIQMYIENVLANLEMFKKTILARAFRGELGTNDENDECAVELLKRVL